jgi:single-stranded-DNA-specific exonuclease
MIPFAGARERISVRAVDDTAVRKLAEELGILQTAARILIGRNITDADVCRRFFSPSFRNFHDPFCMRDMEKAVPRILAAVSRKEKITVYGDYDVDGITGTAILIRVLRTLGRLSTPPPPSSAK